MAVILMGYARLNPSCLGTVLTGWNPAPPLCFLDNAFPVFGMNSGRGKLTACFGSS